MKLYLVIVQCHLVVERCSGYFCEKSFHERSGGFARYPADSTYRTLYISCGGCCGRAVHRKLGHLVRRAAKKEGIEKSQIAVHLASCISKDNYHAPACPHIDYMKTLITEKLGLDLVEGTHFSNLAEQRRKKGIYQTISDNK